MGDANTQNDDDFEAGFANIYADHPEPAPAEPASASDNASDQGADQGQNAPAADQGSDGQAQDAEKTAAADPFASLPPEVRSLLGEVPRLRSELETARRQLGQIPALQSRIDKLTAAPREPEKGSTAATGLDKVEKLRQDGLPEIADALDQIVSTFKPTPQTTDDTRTGQPPTAPTSPVDQAEVLLDDVRPKWRDELVSSDYQLWLSMQKPEYRREIDTTVRPSVILKSLGEFETWKRLTTQQRQMSESRQSRMAGAITPRGTGRGAPAPTNDDDAEFTAGFRSARGA